MPLVDSAYRPPWWLRNGDAATILPSLLRQVPVDYQRERLELADGDFLDLDWLRSGHQRLVMVLHGLEGNSKRHYVAGTARYFAARQWDVLAFNSRSCSGPMNRLPRLYSHADAPDLAAAVDHALSTGSYRQLALVGYSMGGAIILNYLTRLTGQVPAALVAAVAVSAPVDVGASSRMLEKPRNWFYRRRFLKKMIARVRRKAARFPGLIDVSGAEHIRTFAEYDQRFTAPLQGYNNPAEFYAHASTVNLLDQIKYPVLLLMARNDPFMPDSCYPVEAAVRSRYLYLEAPRYGGHVGFTGKNLNESWAESRAYAFISQFV